EVLNMSRRDYLPAREGDLLRWASNFSDRINEDPEAYGLSVEQAGAYEARRAAFESALRAARDPSTNSSSNITSKNLAKEALVSMTLPLARLINANPDVTEAQRADLGLTVSDRRRSPWPAPEARPRL